MGYIFADPTSYMGDVIHTVHFDLNTHVSANIEPELDRRALWQNVDRLVFQEPPHVQNHDLIELRDLRESRWELFKRPRIMPVTKDGLLKAMVYMTWDMALPMVQARLNRAYTWRTTYTVMATDEDNWVICARDLDERVVHMAENYMTLLQRDNDRIYRGDETRGASRRRYRDAGQ